MHQLFFVIFSLLLLCLETSTSTIQLATVGGGDNNGVMKKCSDKERLSLLEFKSRLQEPKGCLSAWTAEEEDCCEWIGVKCNNPTGHVTGLYLVDCDLVGDISLSLLNLTFLDHLDLSLNSFYGTIPKSIGSMTQLNYLDLSVNSFHGTIPLEFGNLTNLQRLYLRSVGRCRVEKIEWLSHLSLLERLEMVGISLAKQNHWVDVILSLPKLSWLRLDGCELSQVMYPFSFSFLNSSSSSIERLSLQNNNLTTSMYRWLFPLTSNKLFSLDLSSNILDGIPSYLANLCSFEALNFSDNSAVVRFPDFLNNLSGCASLSLQELYASNSQLTGSLPDEIQNFTSLTDLYLSHNQLSGTLSDKLWGLPNLTHLSVSSNNFRGDNISENIGRSKLFYIDLSSNSFDGHISNISSKILVSLNLSKNNFSGGISFICQLFGWFLGLLDLSQNFLRGPIPDCLWHLKELKILNLGNNNLSGKLPPSFKYLFQLEVLDLYNNDFSGELPLSLRDCTSLMVLNLGANKFSGNLPIWIGDTLSRLYVLMLTSNNFSGTIPSQFCQQVNLQILDLSKNSLHGTIPSCVKNLTAMVREGPSYYRNEHYYGPQIPTYYEDHAMIGWQGVVREFFSTLVLLKMIDLSSNNLTGQIPSELANLKELVALNLSNNGLLREIPWKIGEMKNLLVLDLSRNIFSGGIPSSMSQMTLLSYLDVSSNKLSGRIPSSTQLQSFDSSRYSGNVGLCGLPLPKKCAGDVGSKVPSVGKTEGDGEGIDELDMWLYIGVGTGFPTGLWIACGTLLLNRRGRHAFFHFYDSFKDWVYMKVVVFFASFKKDRT